MPRLPFLLALGLVTACGGINPLTALRLSSLSPLEADPDDIAIRITLPDGLNVQSGTALLTLEAQTTRERRVDGAFGIIPVGATGIWAVDPDQRPDLRALQATVRDWEERAPDDTTGSVSVTAGFCTTGNGPAPDATVSIDIRIQRDGVFLPLVHGSPIAPLIEAAETDPLGPCPISAE